MGTGCRCGCTFPSVIRRVPHKIVLVYLILCFFLHHLPSLFGPTRVGVINCQCGNNGNKSEGKRLWESKRIQIVDQQFLNDPTPQHKTKPLIKKTHVQYNANCSTQLLQQGDSSALGPVPAFAQHKAKLRVASILSFSAVPPAGSQFCLTRYPAYEPAPTACEVTWPGKNKQNINKAANMRGVFWFVGWVYQTSIQLVSSCWSRGGPNEIMEIFLFSFWTRPWCSNVIFIVIRSNIRSRSSKSEHL